jgi:hypothetical protein
MHQVLMENPSCRLMDWPRCQAASVASRQGRGKAHRSSSRHGTNVRRLPNASSRRERTCKVLGDRANAPGRRKKPPGVGKTLVCPLPPLSGEERNGKRSRAATGLSVRSPCQRYLAGALRLRKIRCSGPAGTGRRESDRLPQPPSFFPQGCEFFTPALLNPS